MSEQVKRTTTRKPRAKKQEEGTPVLKGANSPKSTPKVTAKRKPAAPKPVVFSLVKGGGIWYKIRQKGLLWFDESTGYNREIRYCPAERSVFRDEQSETAKRNQIAFREGILNVPNTDPILLEFMRKHPDNVENGGKLFVEVNTEVDAEKELEKEFALNDAISLIKNSDIDALIPVALSYGISADMSNIEIKRALLQQAKGNPTAFIEALDSPIVKLKANVITAIDFQILKSDAEGMYWYDSNKMIMPTPMGQDTVSVFTRFLMTDKGNPVRDELERQLESL